MKTINEVSIALKKKSAIINLFASADKNQNRVLSMTMVSDILQLGYTTRNDCWTTYKCC